jgi:LDH2 family malate/lactate/ureidoglycolate dehydrogenase
VTVRLKVERIREVGAEALRRGGVPEDHIHTQLDLWLEAELRGVPSHGLLRLPRIVERIANGVADPQARGKHTWRGESFLSVDGEQGLGPIVANVALEAITDKARQTGVAVAAITNSNHIGMLAWYAERVAKAGQSIIVLSTSEALVHPWGGRQALLGTNPISIGVPTGDPDPFVMDTATSIVSMGEIHDRAHRNESIPEDWALDADGNPTTDPNAAKAGAISPFGGPKGYALGLAFGLLVSSLTGAATGRSVRGTLDSTDPCNKGDLFIVIDGASSDLRGYLEAIRSAEPAAGFDKVLVPGERGRACRDERLANGVPMAEDVWRRLVDLAGQDFDGAH